MYEQSVSPDSDTRSHSDIYRPEGFFIIHHQYIRGNDFQIVKEDDYRVLPEIKSL